jgi:hypothetical protein
MGKVTIYRYSVLDTDRVEPRIARRWGTRQAIKALKEVGAQALENSATEVDEAVLDDRGLTALDFNPGST